MAHIGGIYRDDGKENGNYHSGLRQVAMDSGSH